MVQLLTFCDIPWWLTWLLPFLIGLGLGWLLWGKFKSVIKQLQAEIDGHLQKIKLLETDLAHCKKLRVESEGNLALSRGRLRELEMALEQNKSSVKLQEGQKLTDNISALAVPVIANSGLSDSSHDRWTAAIQENNLQIVEGIGPKMEEILHQNHIFTFNQLASQTPKQLKAILSSFGDKYRIIDPNSWPQQASLAASQEWMALIDLQKNLNTGRGDIATGSTDSKLEKILIKLGIIKQWKQDDLKAVEGIGPKIEELLKSKGISTWRILSETEVSEIKKILNGGGPRFQLADPSTWPTQAGLAAEEKWNELRDYQEKLNGGKEN